MIKKKNNQQIDNEDDDKKGFYAPNKKYEITLNPANQCIDNSRRNVYRLQEVYHKMENICISLLAQGIETELYPEIDNKRQMRKDLFNRIHFHGTILFKDEIAVMIFLVERIPIISEHYSIQINSYRPEYWDNYCTGQKHLMEPYCKRHDLAYPIRYPNEINNKRKKKKNIQITETKESISSCLDEAISSKAE